MYVGVNPKTTNPFRTTTTKRPFYTPSSSRAIEKTKTKTEGLLLLLLYCFDRNRAIPRLLVVVSVVARSKRERFKSNANKSNSLKNVLTKLKSAFSLNTTTIDTNTTDSRGGGGGGGVMASSSTAVVAPSHSKQSSSSSSGVEKAQSSSDPFSSETFDPIDFINAIFPDASAVLMTETTLTTTEENSGGSGIQKLEEKLAGATQTMEREVRKSIRDRSIAGERVVKDLELAETAAEQLKGKMERLEADCAKAHERSREISRDVGKLDACKKRLTKAITSLRRLSMFVSGRRQQLETMCHRRNYREAAHLLEAVAQLSSHFAKYGDVPKIQEVKVSNEEIAQGLKRCLKTSRRCGNRRF